MYTKNMRNHAIAGVLYDLVTSFRGVLSIRHWISLGSIRSAFKVSLRYGVVINSAKSIGLRP